MTTTATIDPNLPEPLLTAQDVAGWLGVTETYVYVSAKQGAIPSLMIGRHRRFRKADIDSWLSTLAA